jgi:phage/plasmid-associated DNA primase
VLADFLLETFDDSQQSFGDIRMPFKKIWEFWTAWCNANNEKIRSKTWLGRQLGDRFKKYHDMHEKGYLGLKVKGP